MVRSIKSAIEDGHLPKLITQGSSGSYFCSGGNGEGGALGVFKPKDEEPYGEFNPKVRQW
jgi:phosphatidylinositol 4-kinase type 2